MEVLQLASERMRHPDRQNSCHNCPSKDGDDSVRHERCEQVTAYNTSDDTQTCEHCNSSTQQDFSASDKVQKEEAGNGHYLRDEQFRIVHFDLHRLGHTTFITSEQEESATVVCFLSQLTLNRA